MDVKYQVACGLDVHKETVVACVLDKRGKKLKRETQTFATTTRALHEMRDWLLSLNVEAILMEGTGIFWRPVYAVLESGQPSWTLVVGNAHHVKGVPGRKTDVKDAEWLADLLQHGLIRPSFVPPPAIRLLRDLTRYRKKLVEDRSRQQERILKVLQAANIKLDGVATDAFGVSGMLMLRALAEGTKTPKEMASLAKGTLKKKIDALEGALEGTPRHSASRDADRRPELARHLQQGPRRHRRANRPTRRTVGGGTQATDEPSRLRPCDGSLGACGSRPRHGRLPD